MTTYVRKLKFQAIAKNSRGILFCCNLYWKSCWCEWCPWCKRIISSIFVATVKLLM